MLAEIKTPEKKVLQIEEMSQPSHTSVAHLALHADVR